jgi:nucleoside-diphosphate-sugar epimerase
MPSVALVTGATGFIGSRLAERLSHSGWDVKVLVRDREELTAELQDSCYIVSGSLEEKDTLCSAVQGVDVVFHCAANVATWDRWERYYAANVTGVENLLCAIADHNPDLLRLVHLSTVDVYGFPVDPCDESCELQGAGFGYAETKLLGENLVRKYGQQSKIPYTIIRPCNVIGPGSQFISRIGGELASGLMLTIDGGRRNAGMLHVDNLVDAMIWAAGAERSLSETYNMRDDYDVSWREFIQTLRSGVKGRGIVINLPFWFADGVARILEAIHRLLLPSREPLLHRYLVRVFGRTCGHSAKKYRSHSGYTDGIGFDEAMEQSSRWFLSQRTTTVRDGR